MAPVQTVPAASCTQAGRILALDYGRRRIGVAISDDLGASIRPLPVIERKNREQAIREISSIIRREAIRLVVIGLPLHLSGVAGEMAEEVTRFAERLRSRTGVLVKLHDERLTSWEASQITRKRYARTTGKHETKLDSLAAAVLLRDFLIGRAAEGSR